MTPYKIKHKPTGLYYQPSIENNLSWRGKIYQTGNSEYHITNKNFLGIRLKTDGKVYKSFPLGEYEFKKTHRLNQVIVYIPKSEFEIEYIK